MKNWKLRNRMTKKLRIDFKSLKESELMTDEYHAYNALSRQFKHHVINHQEQYVDGDKHTNTIEGFWSLLKRITPLL